ncbi:MAG: hypothetical protein PUE18_03395 [Firmicutes bacterium]|nr:hypothetical protein [Bacillota bacterium]
MKKVVFKLIVCTLLVGLMYSMDGARAGIGIYALAFAVFYIMASWYFIIKEGEILGGFISGLGRNSIIGKIVVPIAVPILLTTIVLIGVPELIGSIFNSQTLQFIVSAILTLAAIIIPLRRDVMEVRNFLEYRKLEDK